MRKYSGSQNNGFSIITKIILPSPSKISTSRTCEYKGTWQREVKVANEIKADPEMGKVLLNYPDEPNIITGVLKSGRRRKRQMKENWDSINTQ